MAHGDYACCAVRDCKMYYDAFSDEVKIQRRLRGRLKYNGETNAPFSSCILIFRPREEEK